MSEGNLPDQVTVIEGRRTAVYNRRPPLPGRLADLLATPGMRLLPIRITGWRPQCADQDHRLADFAAGSVRCTDGERRDLRLLMCRDCEAVCVRDVSIDPAWRTTRGTVNLMPRRRDKIIAWYSGARRNQRVYT